MARIEGINGVLTALRGKAKGMEDAAVVVGYTASYAMAVHENIEMKWRGLPRSGEVRYAAPGQVTTGHESTGRAGLYWGPAGQAKFLEGPAREMGDELGRITSEAVKRGKTFAQGLVLAGLRLQRESQKRVPVDTGNLRGSAFTRQE